MPTSEIAIAGGGSELNIGVECAPRLTSDVRIIAEPVRSATATTAAAALLLANQSNQNRDSGVELAAQRRVNWCLDRFVHAEPTRSR